MAEGTVGEDGVAGEEDTGAAEVGADEDLAVAGDTWVDVSPVFHSRDTLLLST